MHRVGIADVQVIDLETAWFYISGTNQKQTTPQIAPVIKVNQPLRGQVKGPPYGKSIHGC